MATPFMFGFDRLTIEPGFNPWDVIGPDNPVLQPIKPDGTINNPPRTITSADTSRDASGNLIQRITYSDGTVEDRIIETRTPTPTSTPEQDLINADMADRRQSAFEVLKERFQSFGLASLAAEIEKIYKGEARTRIGNSPIPVPTSPSGFYLALTETDAYYQRFGKVNEARVKAGFTALDERTILGMEDEYQKVMKAYNMPKGFYDTPEDFQVFLANDKSELEIADTLQLSRQVSMATDPVIKDQLKTLYNIDDNMLTAYIADPEKGQALLNQLAGRSLTAASALLSGLTAQAAEIATGYGAGEMRFAEQMQRFGAAQPIAERGQFLSEIEKQQKAFGEKEAIDITFGGLEQSRQAAEKLASRERARFGGAAGTTTTSLTRSTAGQI